MDSAFGLDEIATASFRTTAVADDQARKLKDALGFGAFNIPARLAIARSLAIAEPPADAVGEVGRAIKAIRSSARASIWLRGSLLLPSMPGKRPIACASSKGG